MHRLILFDFDGTLIKGDSTKLAYEALFRSRILFIINYYLVHALGLFLLFSLGKDNYLRESRRLFLVSKFDDIKITDFKKLAKKRIFAATSAQMNNYIREGYEVVIVSAGYKEIIELILEREVEYDIIANSIFEKDQEVVNYDNKVIRLNVQYNSEYTVKAAYGNTQGDKPMLELAEKAFWVDENGRIFNYIK
jgi:phosphoserine phosphatase